MLCTSRMVMVTPSGGVGGGGGGSSDDGERQTGSALVPVTAVQVEAKTTTTS